MKFFEGFHFQYYIFCVPKYFSDLQDFSDECDSDSSFIDDSEFYDEDETDEDNEEPKHVIDISTDTSTITSMAGKSAINN